MLLAAVGGPKWADVPYEARPEAGLLRLRKDLALYANLRPAICYPALAEASSLKRDVVEGLDIMIVRELTGGVYFGEPKQIIDLGNGQKRAIDTQVYDTFEIERIARVAFDLARKRRNKVTSSEKHNVMKSGVLWKEVVVALHKREFADVELEHQLADALGMQLVRWPKQFDVIVTDNLFGDMLSDVASMLTGSLGMLPSASLGDVDPQTGKRKALYEPVHGSAPDIAGKGLANPIAMIGSLGMALRYSFGLGEAADRLDAAIASRAGERPAHRRHPLRGQPRRVDGRDGRRDRRRLRARRLSAQSSGVRQPPRRAGPGFSTSAKPASRPALVRLNRSITQASAASSTVAPDAAQTTPAQPAAARREPERRAAAVAAARQRQRRPFDRPRGAGERLRRAEPFDRRAAGGRRLRRGDEQAAPPPAARRRATPRPAKPRRRRRVGRRQACRCGRGRRDRGGFRG